MLTMDKSELPWWTIETGVFAVFSIVLFVGVYGPGLASVPRGGSVRPMTPLPLLAAMLGIGGWIPCVATGVRQLFSRPRVYGAVSIGIGVLQAASYRVAEWQLIGSRGLHCGR